MKQGWIFMTLMVAAAAIIAAVAWNVCGTVIAGTVPHFGWHLWGLPILIMPLLFMLFCVSMAVGLFRGGSHLESRRHDAADSNASTTGNSR